VAAGHRAFFFKEKQLADKRMFSKSIVLSDTFLDMPASARCLYFTLSMLADDEGFVNNPKSIMRQSGASEDDFKILIAKWFILPFETGVVVIRQWHINNYLRSDRFTPTKCVMEKAMIVLNSDGTYSKAEKPAEVPERKRRAKLPLLEREPENDIERIEKLYLIQYRELFNCGIVQSEKPVINWSISRKLTKEVIENYGFEKIYKAVEKSKNDKFCIECGYTLTTILSAGVLARLLNKGGGDNFTVDNINF
jgi:hypothetical protein